MHACLMLEDLIEQWCQPKNMEIAVTKPSGVFTVAPKTGAFYSDICNQIKLIKTPVQPLNSSEIGLKKL